MSNEIKRSEIAESDLFKEIGDSAIKNAKSVEVLNDGLKKTSKEVLALMSGLSKNSQKDIQELVNLSKTLNKLTESIVRNNKLIDDSVKLNVLSKKEQLSAEQSLQRQREKGIAQMEKEAKKIAEAERPYNKMSATLNDLRKKYKDLAVSGNENTASARAMKREIDSLDKTLKKADGSVGQFQRNVGNYPQTFKAIGSALSQLGLAFGVFSTIRGIAETEIKLQSLQLALKNVMGTQEKYNQSFSFLSKLSRDYGQDLTVLVDTYKGFIASSESSNLSLETRNKIYQSVIKSGSSLALSNDQIQGSLLAISQMFSKGTVSAEELRGQLGERLPGAFGIMAKSIGVSEAELGKMMQRGEVMAKDVLPKFAEELEKTFGANASKNLETIGGAWNVLQTEISLYINEANKGGAITKQIAGAIGFLANNIETIITVLGKAIKAWITFKAVMYAMNLKEQIGNWSNLKGKISDTAVSFKDAESNARKFGQSIKSIGWTTLIGAVSELAISLYDVANGYDVAKKRAELFAKYQKFAELQSNKNIESIQDEIDANDRMLKSKIATGEITQKQALDLQQQFLTKKQFAKEESDFETRTNKVVYKSRLDLVRDLIAEEIRRKNLSKSYIKQLEEESFKNRFAIADEEAKIDASNVKIKAYHAFFDVLESTNNSLVDESNELKKTTKDTKEKTKAIEDYTIKVKELQNARIPDEQQRRTAELELKYTTDLSAIKADGIKANELRIELEKQYLSDLKDLQAEFDKIRNEENDKKVKFINDQHLLDIENQIQAKEIEMQTELNSADSEKEKLQIRKIYGDELRELKIKQLEEQKRIELQNYELTEAEKLAIQQKYDLEILKLKEGTIQAEDELDKKAKDAEKKRLEEMRNFRRQIFNELLDELKRQSEARESQYDKDIQTQKDFQSQLQAQANAGNITAQQSIAQSIEAEKKATIEKAKEAKKQDRLDKIKMYTQMVNNFLDQKNTPAEAGTKAFAGVGIIEGISKFFKGFAKGTKWKLGDEDKPFMSGVDGHIVRVDSSEAIINGGLMNKAEKAGIKSTEQLVNSAVMYQNYNPQMMRMNDDRLAFNSSASMMSIEPITQRLESLEQTIKNKSEFRIDPYIVNGIVKGVMETEKSKNLTRKNIYRS
jgi:tape measure domain-containing protein